LGLGQVAWVLLFEPIPKQHHGNKDYCLGFDWRDSRSTQHTELGLRT